MLQENHPAVVAFNCMSSTMRIPKKVQHLHSINTVFTQSLHPERRVRLFRLFLHRFRRFCIAFGNKFRRGRQVTRDSSLNDGRGEKFSERSAKKTKKAARAALGVTTE